jgi:hypothetical protein
MNFQSLSPNLVALCPDRHYPPFRSTTNQNEGAETHANVHGQGRQLALVAWHEVASTSAFPNSGHRSSNCTTGAVDWSDRLPCPSPSPLASSRFAFAFGCGVSPCSIAASIP